MRKRPKTTRKWFFIEPINIFSEIKRLNWLTNIQIFHSEIVTTWLERVKRRPFNKIYKISTIFLCYQAVYLTSLREVMRILIKFSLIDSNYFDSNNSSTSSVIWPSQIVTFSFNDRILKFFSHHSRQGQKSEEKIILK